jgi:hypothetical protein
LNFAVRRLDVDELPLERCNFDLLRADLLLELAVEPLEAVCIGGHLSGATGGVLRALANLVELVLGGGGVTIDLNLLCERLLQLLRADRCGERGRRERHPELHPAWASSLGYFDSDHENERLLKITCTRLARVIKVISTQND